MTFGKKGANSVASKVNSAKSMSKETERQARPAKILFLPTNLKLNSGKNRPNPGQNKAKQLKSKSNYGKVKARRLKSLLNILSLS